MVNFNPNSEISINQGASAKIEPDKHTTKSKAQDIFESSVNEDLTTTKIKMNAINQKISTNTNKATTNLLNRNINEKDMAIVDKLQSSIDALQNRHVVIEHIHNNVAFVRRNNCADNIHFNSHKADLMKKFEGQHHDNVKISNQDIHHLLEKMIEVAPDAKSAAIPRAVADKHNIEMVIYLDDLPPGTFDPANPHQFDRSRLPPNVGIPVNVMTREQEENTTNLLRKHFKYAVKVGVQQQNLANQANKQDSSTATDAKSKPTEVLHNVAVSNLKSQKSPTSSADKNESGTTVSLEVLRASLKHQGKMIDKEMNKVTQAEHRKMLSNEEKKAEIAAVARDLQGKKLDKEAALLEGLHRELILVWDNQLSDRDAHQLKETLINKNLTKELETLFETVDFIATNPRSPKDPNFQKYQTIHTAVNRLWRILKQS